MQSVVRTIYGAYIQTCERLNKPLELLPNSTLNEKYDLNTGYTPQTGEYPKIAYIGIGNGGHDYVYNENGVPVSIEREHIPRDVSLFRPIPFIARPVDDDLPDDERINYRMRVIKNINGVDYAVYYLKVIDFSNTIPEMEFREYKDGILYSTPFVPEDTDLAPTPQNTTTANTTQGEYLAVTAKAPIEFDQTMIDEIIQAVELTMGDPNAAIISEVGIFTGLDKTVVGQFDGSAKNYIDAVIVQPTAFISAHEVLRTSSGFKLTIDVGTVDPNLSLIP